MIIHDRTRLTGWLISFILVLVPLQAHAYGPTDAEVIQSMYDLDLFRTSIHASEDASWAYDEMRHCTVQLHSGTTFGTGCIYEIRPDALIIVSNRHVIEHWIEMPIPTDEELSQDAVEEVILSRAGDRRSFVLLYDGTACLASLIGVSSVLDVGFLRVPLSQIPEERLIFLRSLRLAQEGETAHADDRIFAYESLDISPTFTTRNISVLAKEAGIAQTIHEGSVIYPNAYIEQFETTMLFALCKARSGMSGGGIWNLRGLYYGIVTGGNERGEMIGVRASDVLAAAREILQ